MSTKPWWYRFSPAIFAVTVLILAVPLITYAYFAHELESKERIMNFNDAGVVLVDKHDNPFFSFYQAKPKEYVSLRDVPREVQLAVIAIEDKDFYHHPGFSIRGIFRSFFVNIVQRDLSQGGSTITQQLIKNSLLNPQKNFLRKYQEIVLAQEVERRYTKSEILEMYLNSVYFGEGAFGIESASEVYFGKPARELSLAEAAFIAGILPAPSVYSPFSGDVKKARERQKLVLEAMYKEKYITRTEFEKAVEQPLLFTKNNEELNVHAPHFALMVKEQLIQKFGEEQVVRGGFRVKTTLDLDWQKYAEEVVKKQVDVLKDNKVSNGAVVVIDPSNGEVRVLVGSKDWYDEQNGKMNMATSPRQPGSSFKPLVYATALESRIITPATMLKDVPTAFQNGTYRPNNYDKKFRGNILARKALAMSLNIPTVQVMEKIGLLPMLDKAKKFGITTLRNPSEYGVSLSLGTAEIPLLELTNAYTAFAHKGLLHDPTLVTQIKNKTGKIIYSYHSPQREVISEDVAFLISSILSDNNARAEVFGNALTINRPAAVKTGTTDFYRDALTIGYTPSLVIGVWVGNNDDTPMDTVAGALGAAPIWRSLMERYLVNTPVEQFISPVGVVGMTVCSSNGYRMVNGGAGYTEYFLSGTEPTHVCTAPQPTTKPSEQKSPESLPSQSTPEEQKKDNPPGQEKKD